MTFQMFATFAIPVVMLDKRKLSLNLLSLSHIGSNLVKPLETRLEIVKCIYDIKVECPIKHAQKSETVCALSTLDQVIALDGRTVS